MVKVGRLGDRFLVVKTFVKFGLVGPSQENFTLSTMVLSAKKGGGNSTLVRRSGRFWVVLLRTHTKNSCVSGLMAKYFF